jgi:hypothetical protein
MGVWASSCLGGHSIVFGGHHSFFQTYPKKFSGHTYKHSTKFSRHSKKNSRDFRKKKKIFLRHQNFSEIFMFCPNFAVIFADSKNLGGKGTCPPPCPPGPYAYRRQKATQAFCRYRKMYGTFISSHYSLVISH